MQYVMAILRQSLCIFYLIGLVFSSDWLQLHFRLSTFCTVPKDTSNVTTWVLSTVFRLSRRHYVLELFVLICASVRVKSAKTSLLFPIAGRKGIRPVKLSGGVLAWLSVWSEVHMAQLMPLPLTVSCFSKIQIGFTFLVPADPGSTGQRAVKRVCVHVFLLLAAKSVCAVKCWILLALIVSAPSILDSTVASTLLLLLLCRFRHSKDAVNAKESMSHALVRSLLNIGETDRLLSILRDKVSS